MSYRPVHISNIINCLASVVAKNFGNNFDNFHTILRSFYLVFLESKSNANIYFLFYFDLVFFSFLNLGQ